MSFVNCYDDAARAAAYATLEFRNTYYLAYRDLPSILREHVRGNKAIDFGCGAGRSTRFVRELGYEVVGLDISSDMIRQARELDPKHEWASFSTEAFPENRTAKSGDRVHIIVTDHGDQRPVEDIVCSDASYRELFRLAGIELLAKYEPLAEGTEPYRWVSEREIAPWAIYMAERAVV